MMASNLLSRLLPSNNTGRSIYEDLQAHDDASESDIEERAGMALDEENLRFNDDELGNPDVFNGEESRIETESTAFLPVQQQRRGAGTGRQPNHPAQRSMFMAQSPRLLEEDPDDDVPASLLIEGNDRARPSTSRQPRVRHQAIPNRQPVPGPSTEETRAQWEAAQAQQRLHTDEETRAQSVPPVRANHRIIGGSARDKAMWRWNNVTNLDSFIQQVYAYYEGAGIWCIIMEKVIGLLTLIFVAVFTTFMTQCIDYKKVPTSKSLSEVMIPQCTRNISGMPNVAIWLLCLYVLYRIYQLLADLPRLMRIHDFFLYLLEVKDGDMQTVQWQEIVARLMTLRDQNPITGNKLSPENRKWLGTQSKQRMDAHDIANRLMRKENYLIALFNKEILDLTLPVPFLQGQQLFSRTLEWNLEWCILDFIFNEYGQVRNLVLKDSHRRELSNGLRDRFLFAGFMNVLCAPVIVVYVVIVYFLRYFNEYHENPSAIGSRQYTPLAEWKFREFNELRHLYHKRVNMSYPFATRYLDQFPKVKTAQIARFVSFVAGAIVAVLFIATVLDPESFLEFKITGERSTIFYIGILTPIWAVARGMIPDENLVFEPDYALQNVVEYTHYMPSHWKDRLHTEEVKAEFATMYKMKVLIFVEEVLSIIITPFLLWFALPKCSDQIIDFFREFTIHVDGVGYVCSFAVFDFKKGVGKAARHTDVRDNYYSTKNDKMANSYFGFLDNYVLNPKTGIPGHHPPGARQQFHPPPTFPGLMSPTLAADMRGSRMGRSEARPRTRPGSGPQPGRTPRTRPAPPLASPMTSILLDPHHQPSSSGFGIANPRKSHHQARPNIIEDVAEDEEEVRKEDSHKSAPGIEDSGWEHSPTRGLAKEMDDDDDEDNIAGGGVLGLLYQFQRAQTEGRPGISI